MMPSPGGLYDLPSAGDPKEEAGTRKTQPVVTGRGRRSTEAIEVVDRVSQQERQPERASELEDV